MLATTLLQEQKTTRIKIMETDVLNFCPECMKSLKSNIITINGLVFLEKRCCKEEYVHMENDEAFFKRYRAIVRKLDSGEAPDYKDVFDRYDEVSPVLNLFVTAKCNINCPICYLKFDGTLEPNAQFDPNNLTGYDKSLQEIESMMKAHRNKFTIISGGDPTVREDLPEVIAIVKKYANGVALLTNGLKLANPMLVERLKKSGLDIVFFQLDSFDPLHTTYLRGGNYLERKLQALQNLKQQKIKTHLVAVISKGMNIGQIPKLVEFSARHNDFVTQLNMIDIDTGKTINRHSTKLSDMIKSFEEYGYFSQDYFFQSLRFYTNVILAYKAVLSNAVLDRKFSKSISSLYAKIILFTVNDGQPVLLFSEDELKSMNHSMEYALAQRSRILKTAAMAMALSSILGCKGTMSIIKLFIKSGFDLPRAINFSTHGILRVNFGCLNAVKKMVGSNYVNKSVLVGAPRTSGITG